MFEYKEENDPVFRSLRSGFAGIILLSIFILFLCLACCDFPATSGGGSYKIISSMPSPDGKNIAIVYAGWGGGAAGWSFLRTTIVSADEQFDPGEHHDYVFDLKGGSDIETTWENNENLLVSYKYKPEKNNPYLTVSKVIYSRHTETNVRFIERNE